MTDKQIIIDGVDVSGCVYFCDGYCNENDVDYKCNLNNENCYYKQLKRKEQECEELKDKLNCCFCNPYIELNDIEKQQKCVEVTECFRRQLDQLKLENKHLNDLLNQALKELEKTRETLTEIKEIAEKCCINQATLDCENYDDCTQCGRISDDEGIQQILQKISEVEDVGN